MTFVINNDNFEEALANGWFAKATDVYLQNLPLVKVIPDMPKATYVDLYNLPLVKVIPDMPNATVVSLFNLPLVEVVPDMPNATTVHLDNLPLVKVLPDMPKAIFVRLLDLPLVKVIPDMPNATYVYLSNLPFVNGFVKQEADLTWVTLGADKVKELQKAKTCKITSRKICSDYEEYTICFDNEADEAEFILRESL